MKIVNIVTKDNLGETLRVGEVSPGKLDVSVDDNTIKIDENLGHLSIKDNGVTFSKIQEVPSMVVLGRYQSGLGDVETLSVISSDELIGASNENIATSLSIKLYIDSKVSNIDTGILGSGDVGYIPVYVGDTSISNSVMFQSLGNIGIGVVTNIDHKLKVAGGVYGGYFQVNTGYSNGNVPGRMSWDSDHDLMFLGLENDYTAKVPQDSVWSCIAGEAITKGQLVYASGTSGNSGKIVASKFIANGTIPSRFVIGVATRTVAQGDTFHALRAGVLRGLDTSAYTQGQDLWASSTVAGGFQTTAPFAPNPKISFAFVITSHANVGEVAIRVAPSVSLGLIDDVQVISPTNGQVLTYDGNRWINSTSVNILTDKQFTDVASGLRQIRSIDYYESRMDFGFDKVLDVPYLYYDKNNIRYVNYMNGDGVFVHVDSSGNQREYLRIGDIASEVPNLQQVSEVGRSSSVRLQWNGIDYAVGTPTLQDVSQQGSNSSIRLKFNGQDYATLQDLIGITAPPTPNLQQVSQQGANSTIRLQLNGVGYATLNDLPAAGVTPNLQQVSQVGANSTIRLQFNGVNYATVNDINTGGTIPTLSTVLTAGNNTGTQRVNFNNFAELFAVTNVSYGNGVFLGTESISNTCHIRLQGSTFELVGLQGAVVDSVSGGTGKLFLRSGGNNPIRMNGIDYDFGQTPTLTAGAKYVFQWDGLKFIIVNA